MLPRFHTVIALDPHADLLNIRNVVFFRDYLPAFDDQSFRIKNYAVHVEDDGLYLFAHIFSFLAEYKLPLLLYHSFTGKQIFFTPYFILQR